MFSSLLEVRLVFWISPYLNILCISSEKRYCTKIPINLSMTFKLLHTIPSNWQWSPTPPMNISRSTTIQAIYTVHPKHHLRFYQSVWHPLCCVSLIRPSSVTGRASDDKHIGSLFVAKLPRVRNWPEWGSNYLVARFSCFYELQCTGNRWHVNGELSFLVSFHWTCAKNM